MEKWSWFMTDGKSEERRKGEGMKEGRKDGGKAGERYRK